MLRANETHHCAHGAFEHNRIVGTAFGSRLASKDGRGWLHLLRPTPELWTATLGHRTQIVYTRDIGVILMWLELRNGSLVVESGTGSGSLTVRRCVLLAVSWLTS